MMGRPAPWQEVRVMSEFCGLYGSGKSSETKGAVVREMTDVVPILPLEARSAGGLRTPMVFVGREFWESRAGVRVVPVGGRGEPGPGDCAR